MQEHIDTLPTAVSASDIHARIKATAYHLLPGTTTTICQITLVNGFTVLGQSACVDPTKYNQALGEKYSFEDAFNKIWPLEGYLLTERRYQATNL
jgi:hypothetical protein